MRKRPALLIVISTLFSFLARFRVDGLWASAFCISLLLLLTGGSGSNNVYAVKAVSDAGVRSTLEQAFQQLRSRDYDRLYESLPVSSRQRITRDRFVSGLQRTSGLYQLDRLQVQNVSVNHDVAAADTTVFGRVQMPFNSEVKLVVRQYLVRENGEWRVLTGDRGAINHLLASNKSLARRFPPRMPQLYIKHDQRWVPLGSLLTARRQLLGSE